MLQWATFLTLGAVGAAALYWGLPLVVRAWVRRRFLARVRRAGVACLTFDDGPDPRATPRILELLDAAGVRATFFVLGERARRHPALAARIARAGHDLAEHGDAHRHAWRTGPLATARDFLRCRRTLAELAAPPRRGLLRPPFGKLNLAGLLYAALGRRRLAFWNLDPRDYAADSAQEVARHVAAGLAPGRVVLLHDGRAREGSDPSVTVAALELILREAGSRGIRLTTLSEALDAPTETSTHEHDAGCTSSPPPGASRAP